MRNLGLRQFPLSVSWSDIRLHLLRHLLHIKRGKQVQNHVQDDWNKRKLQLKMMNMCCCGFSALQHSKCLLWFMTYFCRILLISKLLQIITETFHLKLLNLLCCMHLSHSIESSYPDPTEVYETMRHSPLSLK